MVGAGASNIRIAHLLITAGADPGNILICDSKGTLNKERKELEDSNPEKWELCRITNSCGIKCGISNAVKGADVLIALSRPGPDVIKKEWIATMNEDAVVFACANPTPEIWPWDAAEAGARIIATGRSDFPNQINNSLGFPAIFRGALDVRASKITDGMCIAAAYELADYAAEKGLREDYIIPKMDEPDVFVREAVAVGLKAVEEGVAGLAVGAEELRKSAESLIQNARKQLAVMTAEGLIEDTDIA